MQASSLSPDQQQGVVLVFGGGDAPTELDRSRLPEARVVIAADGGTDHALACGVALDLVVGDLDSVTEAGLAAAAASGALIERHERDKDESDLELALRRALDHHPSRIVVTAVSGGRTDHQLVNVLLISNEALVGVDVDVISGSDRLFVVRGQRSMAVEVDQVVTLLPMHGSAVGVTTTGLQYPLTDETLQAGSSRGLSNIAVAPTVTIEVREGTVLAVLPGGEQR